MSISDILREKPSHVVKVTVKDTVLTAVQKMAEHRIGAVIVEDPWMKLAGIFSERDFVNATASDGAAVLAYPVSRLMTASLITCRPEDPIDSVMATMTMAKIRHLPVLAHGDLVGIVSIGDLVKHRLDEKALEANVLLDIARLHA